MQSAPVFLLPESSSAPRAVAVSRKAQQMAVLSCAFARCRPVRLCLWLPELKGRRCKLQGPGFFHWKPKHLCTKAYLPILPIHLSSLYLSVELGFTKVNEILFERRNKETNSQAFGVPAV